MVSASRLTIEDLFALEPQASQRMTLGLDTALMSADEAEQLCAEDEAWAIRADGRLIAAVGIQQTFPGSMGVCWAILGDGVGKAHLAMTRFAASRIRQSKLARLEAIVRGPDAESILDHFPCLDAAQLLTAVMTMATPECVWARLCGLKPAHVLRKFGAARETHILFERIN
jgi:hypothetical protein